MGSLARFAVVDGLNTLRCRYPGHDRLLILAFRLCRGVVRRRDNGPRPHVARVFDPGTLQRIRGLPAWASDLGGALRVLATALTDQLDQLRYAY